MRTEPLASPMTRDYRDPLVAGLLAVVPGAGHIYSGETLRGFTFLMGTLAGMVLFVAPGVVLWAASIPDAVRCARRRNLAAPPLDYRLAPTLTDGPDPACPPHPSGPREAPERSAGPWPESTR